jgi:ribosome-associated translation inhibitor RaiA
LEEIGNQDPNVQATIDDASEALNKAAKKKKKKKKKRTDDQIMLEANDELAELERLRQEEEMLN